MGYQAKLVLNCTIIAPPPARRRGGSVTPAAPGTPPRTRRLLALHVWRYRRVHALLAPVHCRPWKLHIHHNIQHTFNMSQFLQIPLQEWRRHARPIQTTAAVFASPPVILIAKQGQAVLSCCTRRCQAQLSWRLRPGERFSQWFAYIIFFWPRYKLFKHVHTTAIPLICNILMPEWYTYLSQWRCCWISIESPIPGVERCPNIWTLTRF